MTKIVEYPHLFFPPFLVFTFFCGPRVFRIAACLSLQRHFWEIALPFAPLGIGSGSF